MTRNRLRIGAVVVVAMLACSGAQAQINPFKGNGPKMQQTDLDLMAKAADPLIESTRFDIGAKSAWSNPASGWSGSVTAVGTDTRGTLACRVFDYDILAPRAEDESTFRLTWCQTKNGTWKLG